MILVLSLAAVFLYHRVASHVASVFDTALFDKAQALISLTELDEEGLEFDFSEDGVMSEFEVGQAMQYYQLWQEGEQLLIKSPSLGDHDLPLYGTELEHFRYADLVLTDGRQGRLIEISFMPRVEIDEDEVFGEIPRVHPITLVYARERESLDETLAAIGFTIWGVVISVLIISALLVWRLVSRGLLPLSHLAQQVGKIDEANLNTRIYSKGQQSVEIAPIKDQLNHLLERLQSAFEREKRFSSNVAHELRTPLSELKTLSDVGNMMPDDRKQVETFFSDVGDISAQMERVVTTLLELSRSEAGLLQSEPENVDLFSFCDEVWLRVINGHEANKSLIKNIPENLLVNIDREKFGIILSNLFVNAVSYSPSNTLIEISTKLQDQFVILEVKNPSTDLKPEDVTRMKDRFWRKQKANKEDGHSGLGLTLVDALARVMHLDVMLDLNKQQVFSVTLSGLPLVNSR